MKATSVTKSAKKDASMASPEKGKGSAPTMKATGQPSVIP
jgi:hypothetical protein